MRQAVKNGLVEHGKNPFNHYTFKTVTPQKEKLSEPQIGALPISDGLKAILQEYDAFNKNPGDYLLPLLHRGRDYSTPTKLSGGIASKNTIVNKNLKILADMIGFDGKLTFHIARHSFADISRKKGVNVYDISKLLGHSSISITEQYLRSIDPETFDEALALVYD
jgi:integrase